MVAIKELDSIQLEKIVILSENLDNSMSEDMMPLIHS